MKLSRINPLTDARWQSLLESHPEATIFHTRSWLEALQRTYKYEPRAYAIEDGDRLLSAIPFCAVKSFATGNRLVSLPFSDHCQPLLASPGHFAELIMAAQQDSRRDRLKYVEIRPLASPQGDAGLGEHESLLVHKLDISPDEEQLLGAVHVNGIRRKITRAERENLQYEAGRSEDLLRKFYALLLLTRRRHGLPPQPLRWFRSLIECFGKSLTISVASKEGLPIASILTIFFKKTAVYKYGCSDAKYNALGGNVFLLWRAIQDAKQSGLSEFDFGRSDLSTPGLITFKDRWGTRRLDVKYYRSGEASHGTGKSRLAATAKSLLVRIPDPFFGALGGLLYRHAG